MDEATFEQMRRSIIEMAAEAWRFRQVFQCAMDKLDARDSAKYLSQYSWFSKKVDAALEIAGLHIVNLVGQPFNIGMAVTPLNLNDFEPDEPLFVDQMIEPVIMDCEHVVKTGTVLLRRERQ